MKDILKILEKIRGENMTKAIDSNITDSEWEVMRVVWAQNKTTSKDIRDIIENKKNWKPATTKTLIGRLVDKGVLNTEKDGNKYIYSTNLKESDFLKSTLEQTFDNICNKDIGKIIADLISKSTISTTFAPVLNSKLPVSLAVGIVVTIGDALAPHSQPNFSQKPQY